VAGFPSYFPDLAGVLESLALACAPQVDSGEDHRQLRRPEFNAVDFSGAGHLEASCLERLVPDRQAVTIELEDLDAISPPIDEEEDMTGQGILAEALLDQPGEAVEAFAHVGGPGAEDDPDGGGERDHGVAS
jgi:hypothetical protein